VGSERHGLFSVRFLANELPVRSWPRFTMPLEFKPAATSALEPSHHHDRPVKTSLDHAADAPDPLKGLDCRYAEHDDIHAAVAVRLRSCQLDSVLRFTPLAMAVNVLNAVVLLLFGWGSLPNVVALLWAGSIIALALYGLHGWWHCRTQPHPARVPPLAIRRLAIHSAALALLWATVPVLAFPSASPNERLFVAVVTTGMMGAGGFVLAAVPSAALLYVSVLGSAAAYTLATSSVQEGWAFMLLLGAYWLIVAFGAHTAGNVMTARIKAEVRAEWQAGEITSLLGDFEAHSNDVPWEVDRDGYLVRGSLRLLRMLGIPDDSVPDAPLKELLRPLVPGGRESAAGWGTLIEHVRKAEAFRNIIVETKSSDLTVYWSVSGSPVLDSEGRAAGWRGMAADVTQRHRDRDRIKWLSQNDELTGLANRQKFRDVLAETLRDPQVDFMPFAVLRVHVAQLSELNHLQGPTAVDSVLRAVAAALEQATRRNDLVARYGSDEFAVLLRDVGSIADVESQVARLLEHAQAPTTSAAPTVSPVLSIGAAVCPSHGNETNLLLNRADLALEEVKQTGGGHFRIYNTSLADARLQEIQLQHGLRHGLGGNEFRLVFQPLVRCDDGEISGFEALLRWRNAVCGEIAPSQFIPVAERIGLMPGLGRWVLREAARHAVTWPEDISVSVNVSVLQLQDRDFVEDVIEATRCVDPRRIELEVTESVLISDADAIVQRLSVLRSLGFRIALDDFGSGYSSFSYLNRLRFDTLKIDRGIVNDLAAGPQKQAIVGAILGLGRSFQVNTVAEGVTTMQQVHLLRAMGCTTLQGYLLGRPIAAESVPEHLLSWRFREPALRFSAPNGDAA
jgi:diguanylate cyclase (GGDEF)-like protein